MKLRLLLWDNCNRSCPGCCNKDWDLKALPVCEDFSPYKEILLTGGEPLLYPYLTRLIISDIRETSNSRIFVYTAKVDNLKEALRTLNDLDGMTVTLHTQEDVKPFLEFARNINYIHYSLRLNVFKGIVINRVPGWVIKKNITWIPNCPLPSDFVRKHLLEGIDLIELSVTWPNEITNEGFPIVISYIYPQRRST